MIERLAQLPDTDHADTPESRRRARTVPAPAKQESNAFGQHLAAFYPYRVHEPETRTAPGGSNADARQRPLALQSTAGLSRRRHGRD